MIVLPRRIVLFGVSGSGKSTLGNLLEERFGHESVAFADPIKRAAREIFGFSDQHLYGPSHERETPYKAFLFSGECPSCLAYCEDIAVPDQDDRKPAWRCDECNTHYNRYITPRLALQTLGTEWGRGLCRDLWAQSCFLRMKPLGSYVVTDGRFANERNVADDNKAATVLLRRGLDDSVSTHPSEQEVRWMAEHHEDMFSTVLDNTEGTAEENFAELVEILEGLHLYNPSLDVRHYEDRKGGL